jgi:hypothetical protein
MPRLAWLSLAVVTALLGMARSAAAANKAWIGQTGTLAGDWNVGANWNPAGVPMAGDVVYTGGNSEGRTITLSGSAASVATVFGGAALVIDGTTLQITGGTDPSQLVKADVINGGAVNVTGATELFLGALTLGENVGTTSNGSLTLSAGGIDLIGFVTEGALG